MPSKTNYPTLNVRIKKYELLKQLYISKKHYRSRGLWARTNKGLYLVLKRYGYDAWKEATMKLPNNLK